MIAVGAASHRTTRGFTLIAVIADETSSWRDEQSATPDVEVYRAVMPALVASGGLWVAISTGYRKIGLLYVKWKQHFGAEIDTVLAVQAPTTLLNPRITAEAVQRAKDADPESGEAEWEGGWRADIAGYLDEATIEAAIDYGRPLELPPRKGIRYFGFVDPSGGRHDAYTMCIAHRESGAHVADVILGRPAPCDPVAVTEECSALLKEYRIHKVVGDNYSAEWAARAFRDHGIRYEVSDINRSQIYLEALPLFSRGVVRIPDHPKMLRELRLLERRTSRLGRDVVDHGKAGSDDYSNAVVGALVRTKKGGYDTSLSWVDGDSANADDQSEADEGKIRLTMSLKGFTREQAIEQLKQPMTRFKGPSLADHPDVFFQRSGTSAAYSDRSERLSNAWKSG